MVRVYDPATDTFISINILEYAVVVITYLISSEQLHLHPSYNTHNDPAPILLAYSDNTTAESWTRKCCHSSEAGRALSRIMCCLQINNSLGILPEHISGEDNFIADKISRIHPVSGVAPSFDNILQEFPQLVSCGFISRQK